MFWSASKELSFSIHCTVHITVPKKTFDKGGDNDLHYADGEESFR